MNASSPSPSYGIRVWWSTLVLVNLLPALMVVLIVLSNPEFGRQYNGLLGLLIISLLTAGSLSWYVRGPRTNNAAALSRWEERTRADLDTSFSPLHFIIIFLFLPALFLVLVGPVFVLVLTAG